MTSIKKSKKIVSPPTNSNPDGFQRLFGFHLSDLSSMSHVVRLLNQPRDPASLGVMRILFGLLMVIDIPQERGLSQAYIKYGDQTECRFPLFNFLQPAPVEWMYVAYLIMLLGAVGILLGLMYRVSAAMFVIFYWYIFLLDKTSWNNHSYLYGLLGILLLVSDANSFWSIDGYLFKKKINKHVPLWNYTLLRFQVFLVYFIAGLKKLDFDWVTGYSMQSLSKHWVFSPFTLLMTNGQIDLFIVHIGGLFLDMSMGFLLFFDRTRLYAFFFGASFHLMNVQLFSIGMFPWMMMATMPIFCSADWPRIVFKYIPKLMQKVLPSNEAPEPSSDCLYTKDQIKPEEKYAKSRMASKTLGPVHHKPMYRHYLATAFTLMYIGLQCFLPYSHFVTKGYNNWTNGMYGYSWDMMIHTWSIQHIRVTYVNKDTGDIGYLNPTIWTGGNRRWSSHADMVKQHTSCIERNLLMYNISNVAVYFDVWKSLNDRFQQRMFDPRVDITKADWGPFSRTSWLMPLLVDLSDWRAKLDEIQTSLYNSTENVDVVFVADFPGLYLENYVQEDFRNTSISVLKGKIAVELHHKNFSLSEGDKMQIPSNAFHNVYTISSEPSCYMYIYTNTTEVQFLRKLSEYEKAVNSSENNDLLKKRFQNDPWFPQYEDALREKKEQADREMTSFWKMFVDFVKNKYTLFYRSFQFTLTALRSIATNQRFEDLVNTTILAELETDSRSVN